MQCKNTHIHTYIHIQCIHTLKQSHLDEESWYGDFRLLRNQLGQIDLIRSRGIDLRHVVLYLQIPRYLLHTYIHTSIINHYMRECMIETLYWHLNIRSCSAFGRILKGLSPRPEQWIIERSNI